MAGQTTRGRTGCALVIAVAALSITMLAAPTAPLAAQEVIRLPAVDRPLNANFGEVYRLGSLDEGGWDTFGRVASVGFDGVGNLYILDTGAVRIYVVDLQGNLVRQFIGEGEGPGEFGEPNALGFAVLRDGRVTVYDPNRMGFALFDANGEFERTQAQNSGSIRAVTTRMSTGSSAVRGADPNTTRWPSRMLTDISSRGDRWTGRE